VSERFDAIVVGGGAMGTGAARHLAARGRSVVVVERFGFGHANGSSGGPTRIFRLMYQTRDYVRLALQARPEWDELQEAAGEQLLKVTGGLDVGPEADVRAALLEAEGLPIERLDAREVSERWPSLVLPPGEELVFQPDGGVLRAEHTVRAQARLAAAAGADLRPDTRVTEIVPTADDVEVVTDRGETLHAPVAVASVGPWASSLLGGGGIELPLRPTLEQATYFVQTSPSPMPTLIDWRPEHPNPPYVVPDPFAPAKSTDTGHLKVGLHMSGPTVDPDRPPVEPDTDRIERVRSYVDATLRGTRPTGRTDACMYTIAPDENFVLDRVGPLVIASPCSGHGFKFVPLFGRAIADLAVGDPPPFDVSPYRIDRPAMRTTRARR
jgi:sarcosine oxidase